MLYVKRKPTLDVVTIACEVFQAPLAEPDLRPDRRTVTPQIIYAYSSLGQFCQDICPCAT